MNIKKILLINTPWLMLKGNIWRRVASHFAPIGLASLASVARENNKNIKILDLPTEPLTDNEIISIVKNYSPDLVGFSSTTPAINNALYLAKLIKQNFFRTIIVFGGVHSTIFPEEILTLRHQEVSTLPTSQHNLNNLNNLRHQEVSTLNNNLERDVVRVFRPVNLNIVDAVIRGEGEKTFSEIINGLSFEKINGLSFKSNSQIIHTPSQALISNLDTLPFPAYDLLPIKKYRPALGNYKNLPAVNMIISRGCPGQCTFCYKTFGNTIRLRTNKNILKEIKVLINSFGIREISFYDDTFTIDKEKTILLCELMRREEIRITWSCMTRADFVDKEILLALKKAGCHQICYGIETTDTALLESLKKKSINIAEIKSTVSLTQKMKIDVRCSFMLGNPGETKETLEKMINFAIELSPDLVQFNITTPYPGTQLFNWAEKNNYLITKDWHRYDLYEPVMALPTITIDEIKKYYTLAYRKFFLRPKYLIKRLSKVRRLNDILIACKALSAVLSAR